MSYRCNIEFTNCLGRRPSVIAGVALDLQRAVERAAVTKAVIVERGALLAVPDAIRAAGLLGACQIVADANTMAAAGAQALAALQASGLTTREPIVLGERPRLKPRAETSRELIGALTGDVIPVAVGSGVLNDVTKYAAELAGSPYVSVATAASMDGYAASGGAMLDRGFKRTLACAPPVAVVADLDVLAKAPRRMAAWGYGDLAGKIVAGADWMLADAVGEEPIAEVPFRLVQDNIRAWLNDPDGVAAGEPDALRALMDGLLISGFAMQDYGNSRPASGSEHQISHVWEMEGLSVAGEPAAHGACVGVGSVAMLALYEWFLARDVGQRAAARRGAPEADPRAADAEAVASFARPELAEAARAEVAAKLDGSSRREKRLEALAQGWSVLRIRLSDRLIAASDMQHWLRASGAAAHPADLGVSLASLARDHRRARLIRRRYTILDCLDELEWLDLAIGDLFAADGFWGRQERRLGHAATAR